MDTELEEKKDSLWKDTDDEIVKYAVMKQVKKQLPCIASLRVRMSSKKYKYRSFDGLNQSIKKRESTPDVEHNIEICYLH